MPSSRAMWMFGISLLLFVASGCSCGSDTGTSEATGTGTSTGDAGAGGTGGTTTSTGVSTGGGGNSQGGAAGSGGSSVGGAAGAGGSAMPCTMDADCLDVLYCNGVESCQNGFCVTTGSPCDDGVACTNDACDEFNDTCGAHTPVDSLCNDGLTCTGTEFCNALLGCMSTGGLDCNDNISCTNDVCDIVTDACIHINDDSNCSNSLFCDGVETCNPAIGAPGTGCVAGMPIVCADAITCTQDICNEITDQCDHIPFNAACSDNAFCNGQEICNPAIGCVAGQPPNCNDGLSCTADSCSDAQGGCVHTPNNLACSDGLFCNGQETCSLGGPAPSGCVPGLPVFCPPDNFACTIDECDENTDLCVHTPNNGACQPGQLCNPNQGCVAGQPCSDSSQCQDGNVCNGIEACVGNICLPGQAINCNDNIACTVDSCNPMTGACVHAPDSSACNDGFGCNGVESCNVQLGCVASPPVNCDDGIACTFDQCQEPNGTCLNFPQDFLCDDGVLCNGVEQCSAAGCTQGQPYVCPDDGIACTTSMCDPMLNACVNVPDNSACPCGQTCSPQNGGCGFFCNIKECQGHVYACGDCIDNDGDCSVDDADDQCLGPCDNTENSFYGGIPGQNNSPCKSDCYFDQDTGSGNDDCYWSHKCDQLEVPPNYPPEGSQCSYNPNANIPGYGGSCATAFMTQSQACLDYCGPLTPNGCDCFGCCSLPGLNYTVWLGSENPSGTGSCNTMTINDPNMCKPCTQVQACLNTCLHCEICIGKPDLPPDCTVQECPAGTQACGQPGQSPCPDGYSCITGCCQQNPG